MQKQEYVYVGKRVERPDAIGKVTGETQYIACLLYTSRCV